MPCIHDQDCSGESAKTIAVWEIWQLAVLMGVSWAIVSADLPAKGAAPNEVLKQGAIFVVAVCLGHAVPLRAIHGSTWSVAYLAGILATAVWTVVLAAILVFKTGPGSVVGLFALPIGTAYAIEQRCGLSRRCAIGLTAAGAVLFAALYAIAASFLVHERAVDWILCY